MMQLSDVDFEFNDTGLYIAINGVKIARRENCAWQVLVPGYVVQDIDQGVDCYYRGERSRPAIRQCSWA